MCGAGRQLLQVSVTGKIRWPMSLTHVLGAGGLGLHAQKTA